ncbi:MAG: hypothetical protein JJT89_15825 [Nitriliruptoraceae bacterium]|nr:hypothetical protein [Nitriliruptoraceae bacterium]
MDGPAGRVEATGTVDFQRRRCRAVLALPPHPDDPDDDTVTEVEMILDGADTYTEVIDRPGRFIHDRRASPGDSLSASDPGMLLDLLRGTVGARAIDDDGDPSDPAWTAFEVDIDLDRAMERAPDDLRRQLRESFDGLLRDFRPQKSRVHLDGQGRIRHVDLDIAIEGQPDGRMQVELFDLGAELVVELPDAALILDEREIAELRVELAERFGDDYLEPPAGPDTSGDTWS